jgi:hypothetical protein
MQNPPGSGDGSFHSQSSMFLWEQANDYIPTETYVSWNVIHWNQTIPGQAVWDELLQEEPEDSQITLDDLR